jgi:hypothetical protein
MANIENIVFQRNRTQIKFLQINLQRSKTATAHLNRVITERKIDIVLVQEPYHIGNKVCGFPINYKVFQHENELIPKAAVIIINPTLNAIKILNHTINYMVTINLQLEGKIYSIVSMYCSPLNDMTQEITFLSNALHFLKPQYLIIGVDSNAKSRVWFNNRDDNRGNILNEFVCEQNFIILNDNKFFPTFHNTRGESFIDLTITNINASLLINSWQVLEEDSLSDHRFIQFELKENIQEINFKNTRRFLTKNIDWSPFKNEMQKHNLDLHTFIASCQNKQDINDVSRELTKVLINVCEKTLKIIKPVKTKHVYNWWTNELGIKRRQVNSARRKYQRCRNDNRAQYTHNYKLLKAEYQNLILKTKAEKWFQFIDLNSRENPWGILYKLSRDKVNNHQVNEIIVKNGHIITNTTEIGEYLLNTLFQTDDINSDNIHQKIIRNIDYSGYNEQNDILFNVKEVSNIVLMQNDAKAPGEDALSADIIKNFHSSDPTLLTNLYNS